MGEANPYHHDWKTYTSIARNLEMALIGKNWLWMSCIRRLFEVLIRQLKRP